MRADRTVRGSGKGNRSEEEIDSVVQVVNDGNVVLAVQEGDSSVEFKPGVPTPCSRELFDRVRTRNLDPVSRKPVLREATAAERHNYLTEVQSRAVAASNQKINLHQGPVVDENFVKVVTESWENDKDVSRQLIEIEDNELNITAALARSGNIPDTGDLRSLLLHRLKQIKGPKSEAAALG